MTPVARQCPVFGINIPWWGRSYSHDIGRNARYANWPVWYSGTEVSHTFEWLKGLGITLARLWLFEGGEGLRYDASGRITGLDPTFQANLSDLVTRAEASGISIYWTLFDANSVYRNRDAITHSILCSPDNAGRVADLVIAPLAEVLVTAGWGVDLCNEPEAVISGTSGNWTRAGVSWNCIRPSLRLLRQAVKDLTALPVSIGSGWHECHNVRSGVYSGLELDLDFYDFHSQKQRGYVPGALDRAVGDQRVVVGELGIGGNPAVPVRREEWRRAHAILCAKIECVLATRYEAVFLWYLPQWNSRDVGGIVYNGEISHALAKCVAFQHCG